MHQLIKRTYVAQSLIDEFNGKPLIWGKIDCAHIAAFVLKAFGYSNPLKGIQKYTSERGAMLAMRKAGLPDLLSAIDRLDLERIAPASALSGDIVAYPGEGFGGHALGVALGDGRLMGIAAGPDGIPIVDHAPITVATVAWRVVV